MEVVPAPNHGANGASGLPDSVADEQELTEDQRAFLESVCSERWEPTDAELDAMHAEWLAREEAERIAAEHEHERTLSTSAIIAAGNVAAVDAVAALFDRRTA